jgi:hypothetical protein
MGILVDSRKDRLNGWCCKIAHFVKAVKEKRCAVGHGCSETNSAPCSRAPEAVGRDQIAAPARQPLAAKMLAKRALCQARDQSIKADASSTFLARLEFQLVSKTPVQRLVRQ